MSLRRNYLYTIVTQAASLLTPLLTAPYVARVLGSEGVGTYSYLWSVATTFSLFAALGLSAYGLREASRLRDNPEAVARLFWELTLLRWGATAATLAAYAILGVWWGGGVLYAVMGLQIASVGLDATWLFQATERFGVLTARHLAVRLLTVALTFLLVRDAGDVTTYALIQMGGGALSHLLLWPSLGRLPRPADLRPPMHLRRSLVYFVPAVATSVYTVLDKTMLGAITGDMTQSGYYESAHKIIRLLLAVVTSLNLVVGVRTGYLFGQEREDEARGHLLDTYRFTCGLAFPLWGGLMACARPFAVAFFGAEFAAAGDLLRLFAPLLFLIGTSGVLGSLYLTPAGYRRRSNRAILAGAAVNVTLNLLLIPRLGAVGAVAASVAAEGVIAVLYLRFARDFVSPRRLLRMAGRYALYGGAVWAVAGWLLPRCGLWVAVAGVVAAYLALLLLCRDPLWGVWRRLRGGEDPR